MDITYHTIRTTPDKLMLYRFRKQVFVDEEGRWHTSDDHLTDLYDSLDETVNLAAFCKGKIIAALRITVEGSAGLPGDHLWQFKSFRSHLTGRCVNFGWLCCTRAFRHQKGLIRHLVAKGAEQAKAKGARHILAAIHPPIYDLLHTCFGVQQIGTPFLDTVRQLEMLPIHGQVDEILSRYTDGGQDHSPPQKAVGVRQNRFRNKYHFLDQALSRNLGILSPADHERLINARVAIPGLGGVGGQHLITLARTGVGAFSIADFDTFETKNFNRQYGARLSNLDRPKLKVMAEDALEVNPFLDIRTFPQGVTPENIDAFLSGVDLVADGMDFFNIDIRRLIFTRAREKNIPVITAGPLGFSAALLIFLPGRGMGFDRYFNISDHLDLEEKLIRFFVGLAPKATQAVYTDPAAITMSGQQGPSTGAGCLMCSGVLAAEALRILLDKNGIRPAPHYFQYDPFSRRFVQGYLALGNRNPVQRLKIQMVKQRLQKALPLGMPPEPDRAEAPLSQAMMAHLVNAGCQAPSGDNCQPWAFTWKGNCISLFLTPEADTSFFNVNQMASHIACGAAVENICLAAGRFGLGADVRLQPEPDRPELLAQIRLRPDRTPESPLARFIWSRHTNRTRFSGKPIPEQTQSVLEQSIGGQKDIRLTLIIDRDRIRSLSRLIYAADTIRVQRRDLHTHFMRMVRFTREQALLTRDGLPLRNLEAGMAGGLFLRIARPWSVMHLANRLGLGNAIPRTAARWVRQSSAMGLITVRGKDVKSLMTGGRALEHFWLSASAAGISFQPMTAITLFRERWDAGGKSQFSLAHQQRLGRIWPVFDHLFPAEPDETRIMLFRLGYGSNVACRPLRRYLGTPGEPPVTG